MKKKIFFDMDGTLSKFYKDPMFLENMYTPGYFIRLEPYESMVSAIATLLDSGHDVFILSACTAPFEEAEKREWLARVIPDLNADHALFCKAGASKSLFVRSLGFDLTQCILVDDYSKNLIEWVSNGGRAVKSRNEINCRNGKWQGQRVDALTKNIYAIVDTIVNV